MSRGIGVFFMETTTENLLAKFTTASTCKSSDTTTIAGQKTDCAKSAAKLATAVEEAITNHE